MGTPTLTCPHYFLDFRLLLLTLVVVARLLR